MSSSVSTWRSLSVSCTDKALGPQHVRSIYLDLAGYSCL